MIALLPEVLMVAETPSPIRILELRYADGTGGGPDKTILLGSARADPDRFAVTVCYIRGVRDGSFDIAARADRLGLDYAELTQRHGLDPAIWPAARRLVRQRRIDIVHAHDYKTNLLALGLSRAEGVIPLSTAHGYTGHTRRERWLYYPADRRLLARFPRVIAVSSQLRAELLRHGARPERVSTILNGIDHRAFRRDPRRAAEARAALGLGDEETAIGAVGRLEPQKRFDVLMHAFAALRRGRPGLRLLIAGEGGARGMLEAEAVRLGLGPDCRLLGHRADIADFYQAIDLYVQSSDYEGTPNVVLEAMALEAPIVATDVGGTAELLVHGIHGLIVPPGSPGELAASIGQALDDREATARRVAAARKRVEGELSFEARMGAVESIYGELMAGASRQPARAAQ
jgi:glycosyltransferase involved in cell wall biosynthesis